MNNNYINKNDYDQIKTILISSDDFKDENNNFQILKSLDDVFDGFENLIQKHPYYIHDTTKISDYLKKEFGDVLSNAIKNDDSYKVNEICFDVGKIFSPKSYGFFKKKMEEFALSYAFNSLVKQYKICNPKV